VPLLQPTCRIKEKQWEKDMQKGGKKGKSEGYKKQARKL